MKKKLFKKAAAVALSGIFAASLLTGCGGNGGGNNANASKDSPGEINIYTWQGYIPPDIVERFQNETGITINYSYFSTNEEMLAKLEATEGGEYDIILCSDYIIDIAKGEDLLQEIDSSKIENYKNINPVYQGYYYDEDNKYSIPYWISSYAILYDPAQTDLTFERFSDLADPSLKDKVAVVDEGRAVIGAALDELGYSINEKDPDHLAEAEEFLKDLRPNIVAFDTDNPEGIVANGDAAACYCTAPQCIAGIIQDPTLKISYPETGGSSLCIDSFVVPKNAPNIDNVYTFLNFELDPDVAEQAAEYTHYTNSNLYYTDYFPEGFDTSTVATIPDSILENVQISENVGDAQEIYSRIWTEYK